MSWFTAAFAAVSLAVTAAAVPGALDLPRYAFGDNGWAVRVNGLLEIRLDKSRIGAARHRPVQMQREDEIKVRILGEQNRRGVVTARSGHGGALHPTGGGVARVEDFGRSAIRSIDAARQEDSAIRQEHRVDLLCAGTIQVG